MPSERGLERLPLQEELCVDVADAQRLGRTPPGQLAQGEVPGSGFSRQPLSPAPIEALQHGVDLLLALSGLEIFQGLEPERLDGGGALKPPGPLLGHQLCRLLQVCSAALADQGSQKRVCLGGGRLIRLEARQLVGQRLEQEHGRRQLRAQGRLQLEPGLQLGPDY
jgi:hypothetical protein